MAGQHRTHSAQRSWVGLMNNTHTAEQSAAKQNVLGSVLNDTHNRLGFHGFQSSLNMYDMKRIKSQIHACSMTQVSQAKMKKSKA